MGGPYTQAESIPQPQASNAGPDVAALLSNVLSSNQAQLGELAKKAATPIPGGHATALPLSMDPTPKQYQQAPLDHREVVGAGNAKGQGIGNSVIAVMNAIGATKTALDNKKRLEVASATQQLLTAQQAYDQAAQLYKSDPSNQDVKAAMDRNKIQMNTILDNKKIRDAIERGMHVNFMDHSENNTLEHQGVAQGKEMAKAHVDYAEQFNQQTPQVMQPNQKAIAEYQAAAHQQKLQVEAMRAIMPLFSAQIRVQGQIKAEELKQTYQTGLALAKSQDAWSRLQYSFEQRAKLQNDRHAQRLSEIGAEGSKDIAVFRQKLSDTNPTKSLKAYNEFQTQSAGKVVQFAKVVSELEAQRTAIASKPKGDAEYAKVDPLVQRLDIQILEAKKAEEAFRQYVDNTNEMYKKQQYLLKGGEADAGAGTDTATPAGHVDLTNSDTYADDEIDNDEEPNY